MRADNPALQEVLAYNQAGAIAINTVLGVIDCEHYRSLLIHAQSIGTGATLQIRWANNPQFTNEYTGTVLTDAGTAATSITAGMRSAPIMGRYARLILSVAATGGTTTINVQASQSVQANAVQAVAGSVSLTGTATVLPTNPTQYLLSSAATTNAASVKNAAGNVYGIVVSNVNAAARYLKLYNKASAPTVGTDVPVLTVPVPATSVVSVNLGALGIRLGTGIAIALTTGAADTDATAVAAAEIKVAISYQ